jgi:hypothetical protein
MSAADKTKLDGIASGAEVYVNADWIATSGDSKILNKPTGTSPGQMLYWDGTAWINVASGLNGQVFKYIHGVPTWCDGNIEDLVIGDAYKGGIIAYFLQSGNPGYDPTVKHGLIASPHDQGNAPFGCAGITVGTSNSFGSGATNTAKIIDSCSTTGISSRVCSDLVLNGYDDWFLPSMQELQQIYPNKDAIGGYGNGYYTTSSEYGADNCIQIQFSTGRTVYYTKTYPDFVRCIRTF